MELTSTWFEKGIILEHIRNCFPEAKEEIRIASGFFTIKGWGLIRRYTEGKKVYLLVGIDEPGEKKARDALVKEIMRDLATGRDIDRRQSVQDLVNRMESGALSIVDARAASHHGKFYIVDGLIAIVASSNTTGKGFLEQFESGALISPSVVNNLISKNPNFTPENINALYGLVEEQVNNLITSFDKLFANAIDITQELLKALKNWLDLCLPWDIYLKTILVLETIKPVKTPYGKQALPYQQDMISQTLRQLIEYGGSMLVASTGLGKTVMGTLTTIQLCAEDLIDSVIVICPKPVRKSWKKEMRDASISMDCFTLHVLDLQDSSRAKDLEDWEDIEERIRSQRGRYLLILDESHQLRNRYSGEFSNRRSRNENLRERLAFTRINKLVNEFGDKQRVMVLLLTGSPYATNIDNINTQLALLPHTALRREPVIFEDEKLFPKYFLPWEIKESSEFINLPVTNQLTASYVAKYYAQIDLNGKRYLYFGEEKKYFPNILLRNLAWNLPFENELFQAIYQGYFDLNFNNSSYRKNIETQVKIAWSSSPLALLDILERVVDTPGGKKQFDFAQRNTSQFVFDKKSRQEIINPIIKRLQYLIFDYDKEASHFCTFHLKICLENLGLPLVYLIYLQKKYLVYNKDNKLHNLLQILRFHSPQQEKVIIFCERLATAYYLEEALTEYIPELQVFSTVEKNNSGIYETKKTKEVQKEIEAFAPVANNAEGKFQHTYDVFISTDAFGVGLNMQDASVVVNYDLAWTPIEPIQRVGRVLRPWDDYRNVYLYTFIPTLESQTKLQYQLLNIQKRWDKLIDRHDESLSMTDFPVLTTDDTQRIDLPDFAPDIKITAGTYNFEKNADDEVSSFYNHTKTLHPHRKYAQNLPSDLISALTYPGKYDLLYLLLKYLDKNYLLIYDIKDNLVREPSHEFILNLIQCTPETQPAIVDPEKIEQLSDKCISIWCKKQGIDVDKEEVFRECTLYLKAQSEDDSIESLLKKQE